MIFRCLVFLLFVLASASPMVTQAAIDSFTVGFLFGEDSEAPTVPGPVSVVPVASTQIDVTWGASTDNVQVGGYQLFRDGTQVATTSLLSFSDTGLTANTTYSYTVIAFDLFGNFSTSSTPIATTTLPLPPTPEILAAEPPSGTLMLVERAFTIQLSTNGARFSWGTNIPTAYVLRYSESSNLDDGILQGTVYSIAHETVVSGLKPGTSYQYELVLTDIYGRTNIFRAGNFVTDSMPDTTPPTNVGAFVATVLQNDVLLRWTSPLESDFAYVRVVRNHLFFPQHDSDGFVVYEGSATAVTDGGALSQYDTQYYTIFAYDLAGNQSSGAVAIARRYETPTAPPTAPTDTLNEGSEIEEMPDTLLGGTGPIILELYPEQVFIEQEHETVNFADRLLELFISNPYTVWIPASALPPHLKAIIVSVKNPTDQRQVTAYLLRLNTERQRYETTIPGFLVVGESVFTLEVFDFNAAQVREISVPVRFVSSDGVQSPLVPAYVSYAWSVLWPLLQLLLIGLLFILSLVLWRRRRSETDEININEDNH